MQNELKKPVLMMLIGIPCSGKSTWRAEYIKQNNGYIIILSTDDYLEAATNRYGITYQQAFELYYKDAENHIRKLSEQAIEYKSLVIWDQTNIAPKARIRKLKQFKDAGYELMAVYFPISLELAKERNANRFAATGKNIPEHIIENMYNTLVPPSYDEGFDNIIVVS